MAAFALVTGGGTATCVLKLGKSKRSSKNQDPPHPKRNGHTDQTSATNIHMKKPIARPKITMGFQRAASLAELAAEL